MCVCVCACMVFLSDRRDGCVGDVCSDVDYAAAASGGCLGDAEHHLHHHKRVWLHVLLGYFLQVKEGGRGGEGAVCL